MESAKGFFEALFDFSFTSFVTSKLVKLLYALAIVAAALGALVWIVAAFSASPVFGVLALLIGAPLFFVIGVIYSRVLLEIVIVIFRISEHVAEMAAQGRQGPSRPTLG